MNALTDVQKAILREALSMHIRISELEAENKRVNEDRLEIWAERNKLITENERLQAEAAGTAALHNALLYYANFELDHEGESPDMNVARRALLDTDAGQDLLEKLQKLESSLKWIAQQPCTHEYHSYLECADTDACITEYCLPCYARQALAGLEKGDQNADY